MNTVDSADCAEARAAEQGGTGAHGLIEVLEGIERDLILAALKESHGNKAKAARALGITERFMGLRVKRLGIDWRGLRPRTKRSATRTTSLAISD